MGVSLGHRTLVGIALAEDFASSGTITWAHASRVQSWTGDPGEQFRAQQDLGDAKKGTFRRARSQVPTVNMPKWSVKGYACYNSPFFEVLLANITENGAKTGSGPYTKTYDCTGLNSSPNAVSGTYPYIQLAAIRGSEGLYEGVHGGYVQTYRIEVRAGEMMTWTCSGTAHHVVRDDPTAVAATLLTYTADDDVIMGGHGSTITWNSTEFSFVSMVLEGSTGRSGVLAIGDITPGEPFEVDAGASLTLEMTDAAYLDLRAAYGEGFTNGEVIEDGITVTFTSRRTPASSFSIQLTDCFIESISDPINTRGVLMRTIRFVPQSDASTSGLKFVCVNATNGPV